MMVMPCSIMIKKKPLLLMNSMVPWGRKRIWVPSVALVQFGKLFWQKFVMTSCRLIRQMKWFASVSWMILHTSFTAALAVYLLMPSWLVIEQRLLGMASFHTVMEMHFSKVRGWLMSCHLVWGASGAMMSMNVPYA